LQSFGVGCVAQAVLNSANFRFNYAIIPIGWGLAVASGVYVCGGVSGERILNSSYILKLPENYKNIETNKINKIHAIRKYLIEA